MSFLIMDGAGEINAEAKNTIKSSFTPLLVREDLAYFDQKYQIFEL